MSIIIGCVIFIINFISVTEFALQQTVQYLGYVCASFFVAFGIICIHITLKLKTIEHDDQVFKYQSSEELKKII